MKDNIILLVSKPIWLLLTYKADVETYMSMDDLNNIQKFQLVLSWQIFSKLSMSSRDMYQLSIYSKERHLGSGFKTEQYYGRTIYIAFESHFVYVFRMLVETK